MKRKMGERKKTATPNKKKKTEWPTIKTKSDLQISRLKDDELITIKNYLTSAESKAFIDAAESIGFVHQGSLGPTRGEAYRDNDRISVDDPVLAQAIWDAGLSSFFSDFKIRSKVAVGLNPNIRFYRLFCGEVCTDQSSALEMCHLLVVDLEDRYSPGQRFGRHIDESTDLGEGRRTHYTLLIYLSGAPGKTKVKSKNDVGSQDSLDLLVGGETVFYGPRNALVAEVPPTEGMALLHIHGDKCMLHEARNVSKGMKYVLRSDVVFA